MQHYRFASGSEVFLGSNSQNTVKFANPSQYHCNNCDQQLWNACTGCVHCSVDCPVLWPKIGNFLEEVRGLGLQGGILATALEFTLVVELLTTVLSVGCDDVLKELTGHFGSAVVDLLVCRVQDDGEDDMSGQAMVGLAGLSTIT